MPERIFRQFEEDSISVRELSRKALEDDAAFDKRSQYMAFVIILVGMLGTFLLAYFDKDIAAICTGIGTAALIFRSTFSPRN